MLTIKKIIILLCGIISTHVLAKTDVINIDHLNNLKDAAVFVASSAVYDIDIASPDIVFYNEPAEITVTVTKNSPESIAREQVQMYMHFSMIGEYNGIFWENWSVQHRLENCGYVYSGSKDILFSQREGGRFSCSSIPTLAQGESFSLTIPFTPNELAHYQLLVSVGDNSETVDIPTNPRLTDTDTDGVIDLEETLAGSDPYSSNSLPTNSDIDLLLFYTPEISAKQSALDLNNFFIGLQSYLNQLFMDSEVRINIKLVHTEEANPPGGVDEPIDTAIYLQYLATHSSGFERLTLLKSEYQPDIVGVIYNKFTMDRGFATANISGSNTGYFSAVDDFEVIAHEIGHILGADHDYANTKEGAAFNFSYGLAEGNFGTIMSYAENTVPYFSSPNNTACGLSICGVTGLDKTTSANNALTMNLRRLFMGNAGTNGDPDEDNDGMPDFFESGVNNLDSPLYNHCLDQDGDGVPNISEYQNGTDPTDQNDFNANINWQNECETPQEQTIMLTTEKNTRLDFDLRTVDSKGRLFYIPPSISNRVSWEIAGIGLYQYTPEVDFEGTEHLTFPVSNGVAGESIINVYITVGIGNMPIANAGIDQVVESGDVITLDASTSTDLDGDELTYEWILTSAPSGSLSALSNTTAVNPTFTADMAGTYVFELLVSDNISTSVADEVVIVVNEEPTPPAVISPPSSSNSGGSGGALSLWLVYGLLFSMFLRSKRMKDF